MIVLTATLPARPGRRDELAGLLAAIAAEAEALVAVLPDLVEGPPQIVYLEPYSTPST